MSKVKLPHFFSFIINVFLYIACVHSLLSRINFRISVNDNISCFFFFQYLEIDIINYVTPADRHIFFAFPGMPLCVFQAHRCFC